jgi:hypothetical protein
MRHHGHLEDRRLLESKVVLGEDTQPQSLGFGDEAIALLVARDDSQQGALAGAVGADQPVAAAWVELEIDVGEEDLAAVPLGEIGDRDHGNAG